MHTNFCKINFFVAAIDYKIFTTKISRFAVYSIQCIFIPITTCTGIKNSTDLQQELTTFNNGQDFDGLEHFTYNNSGFVNLLFDHLSDTNFDGITVCYPYSNTAMLYPCPLGQVSTPILI